jgi:hypothetical protein
MIEFLGIGAQKAATTWLTENLRVHPQVWMPGFAKELHYFDVVHRTDKKRFFLKKLEQNCSDSIQRMQKAGKQKPEKEAYLRKVYDPDFAFTDDWYGHIFSAAPVNKVRGEFTPLYSTLNHQGIAHVKKLMPDVKLIHIIRDPVDRALSSLRMSLARRDGKRAQETTLGKQSFWDRGDYAHNIPAWEEQFAPEQIVYLPFGLVRTDPLSVLRSVEASLGLTPFDAYPFLGKTVHKTKGVDIAITAESHDLIVEKTKPQYVFLKERFGDEFVSQLK